MGRSKHIRHDKICLPPDRLSALPESAILLIFSFLDIKEVIQTSVLARSWRYRWTCVSSVKIDERSKLCWNKVLTNTKTTKITVFMKFISWVQKVTNSESLRLKAIEAYGEEPFSLVKALSLEKIQVVYSTPFKVRFTRFLSNYTHLKKLSLKNCDGLNRINIEVSTLEFLAIENCERLKRVEIITPLLKTLRISNWTGDILAIDAPNVANFQWLCSFAKDTTIGIMEDCHVVIYRCGFRCMMIRDLNADFIKKVSHVRSLKLDSMFFQYFAFKPPMFLHLKHLKLSADINCDSLQKFISLLRSCPKLEKLTLKITPVPDHIIIMPPDLDPSSQSLENIPCLTNHVTHVEFVSFSGLIEEYKLIGTLLSRCQVLETLVVNIYTSRLPMSAPAMLWVAILKLPKASKNVRITFT